MNTHAAAGLVLSPPSFADGLDVWSSRSGRPGSPSYERSAHARLVEDSDFGTCLELTKTEAVQHLRYTGETPILPGCPLRIIARIRAVSAPVPTARIAAWPGTVTSAHAKGMVEHAAAVGLSDRGEIVDLSAVIGQGGAMPWGGAAVYGHVGLDLLGPVGGVVRIAAIRIEPV